MSEVVEKSAAFERHPDTTVIAKLLRDCAVGDVVTYEMLDAKLHRSYRANCIGHGQSARKMLQREGIYFRTVANVGFQRLSESEKITYEAARKQKASRNRIREALHAVKRTDFAQLSSEERTTALTMAAQMQAADMLTSSRSAKKIEMAVSDEQQELPIGRILEMFQK